MERLSDDVRRFIVQRLAMFDTPSQVAEAVKAEFGIEVTRQAVRAYDPTARNAKKPARKWAVIFEETRKRFLAQTSAIPIAQRAVRLRRLDRMYMAAESSKNYALAAQLLEQAAKEEGELFTNARRLQHSASFGGGVLAVPMMMNDGHAVTAEEWSRVAASQQSELRESARAAAAEATVSGRQT